MCADLYVQPAVVQVPPAGVFCWPAGDAGQVKGDAQWCGWIGSRRMDLVVEESGCASSKIWFVDSAGWQAVLCPRCMLLSRISPVWCSSRELNGWESVLTATVLCVAMLPELVGKICQLLSTLSLTTPEFEAHSVCRPCGSALLS
jgi:hypothetical protein